MTIEQLFSDTDLARILEDYKNNPHPYTELGKAADLVIAYRAHVEGGGKMSSELEEVVAILNQYMQNQSQEQKL